VAHFGIEKIGGGGLGRTDQKRLMLSKATPEMLADFDDPIPSFGSEPAIGG
jgi:hypothetical protein